MMLQKVDEGFSGLRSSGVVARAAEFHCELGCVLNLQILTQAISLVFSYLRLTG